MRIAFDHQVFSFQKHGGVSRYFAELIAHLGRQSDVQLRVVAPFHVNQYLQRPEVRQHVRGRHVRWRFRGNARAVAALNRAVLPCYWARLHPDIIHETYFSSVRRGHARVRVLTIYDMINELFPEEFPNAGLLTEAKRAAVARADHIICISQTTRRDAMRLLGIAPERASVVYLGCSLEGRSQQNSGAEVMQPCFLYVGRRAGYKNFRVVLDAFAASEALHRRFKLVAFGDWPFSSEEQRTIAALGLGAVVQHIQGDDTLLGTYYRSATALVYPSRYEGFGIPPLEAMAIGCPVVCSNAGSIAEIVGDAAACFLPDDPRQLRGLLERVADDRAYAQQLRERGFERVKAYSWSACAQQTALTYRRLLGNAATGLPA